MKQLLPLLLLNFGSLQSMESIFDSNSNSLGIFIQELGKTESKEEIDTFVNNLQPITINYNNTQAIVDQLKNVRSLIDGYNFSFLNKYEEAKEIKTKDKIFFRSVLTDFILHKKIKWTGKCPDNFFSQVPQDQRNDLIKLVLNICRCSKFTVADRVLLFYKTIQTVLKNYQEKKTISILSFGCGNCLYEYNLAQKLIELEFKVHLILLDDFQEKKNKQEYLHTLASILSHAPEVVNKQLTFAQHLTSPAYLQSCANNSAAKPDIAMAIDLVERAGNYSTVTDMMLIKAKKQPTDNSEFLRINFSPKGRFRSYYSLPLTTEKKEEWVNFSNECLKLFSSQISRKQLEKLQLLCTQRLSKEQFQPIQFSADPFYEFQELVEKTAQDSTIAYAAQNRVIKEWQPRNAEYNPQEFISPFDYMATPFFNKENKFTSILDIKLAKEHPLNRQIISPIVASIP